MIGKVTKEELEVIGKTIKPKDVIVDPNRLGFMIWRTRDFFLRIFKENTTQKN